MGKNDYIIDWCVAVLRDAGESVTTTALTYRVQHRFDSKITQNQVSRACRRSENIEDVSWAANKRRWSYVPPAEVERRKDEAARRRLDLDRSRWLAVEIGKALGLEISAGDYLGDNAYDAEVKGIGLRMTDVILRADIWHAVAEGYLEFAGAERVQVEEE